MDLAQYFDALDPLSRVAGDQRQKDHLAALAELQPLRMDCRNWPLASAGLQMSMRESGDAFYATVDVPGCKRDEVSVSVTGRMLTINAHHEVETVREDESHVLWKERAEGLCSRTISLPASAAPAHITSRLADGVLRIKIPKVGAAAAPVTKVAIA